MLAKKVKQAWQACQANIYDCSTSRREPELELELELERESGLEPEPEPELKLKLEPEPEHALEPVSESLKLTSA